MTGIRVVKGDPSAEELAALVLVLLGTARAEHEPAPARRPATWRPPAWTPPTWKG
ncbi:acyl-CoA carboxylase epsilon subunit [Kibdelosporangium persicum]|uniref:acyl-CoA carboxylase epsilon subunit n=1 Tax=Kibdelosporangium persicum TaxID=2698649 RepID=UPI0015653249|nr:acyl-CoA carboxylase epsilon subunit [Kibdelosporangium persicum]